MLTIVVAVAVIVEIVLAYGEVVVVVGDVAVGVDVAVVIGDNCTDCLSSQCSGLCCGYIGSGCCCCYC